MHRLVRLLDAPDAVIEGADQDDWPADFIQACDDAGLVVPCTKHSDFIRCPGCNDPHDVEVQSVWFEGKHHSIAVCPSSGVLRIAPTLVERWRPSLLGLAKMIANALGIESEPESAVGADAFIVGNVVRGGKAIKVCVGRRSARWDRIVLPNVQHAVVLVGHLGEAGALTTSTIIKAADMFSWTARDGVTLNVDLIRALLQLNPDGQTGLVPRDGFEWPDKLVIGGANHRCPTMKPQLKKLLSVLSTRQIVPIEEVVHEGENAVWRQRWNSGNTNLIRAIRTALNELKVCLGKADPPLHIHFTFQKKWERISRRARR